jgi:uncharacterized YccA/Bax inhibitor family protein
MPGLVLAWAVGEGIIIYRAVKVNHAPPMPGALLGASGLFIMLALLSEGGEGAGKLATALAWGFDVAAFLNLFPEITGGGVTSGLKGPKKQEPKPGVSVA